MAEPVSKNPQQVRGVAEMRGPRPNRSIQRDVPINSAVPKTAGMTVEKLTDASTKYSRSLNNSPPRYCQFAVRQLMISNTHQAGAEMTNNIAKSRGDRVSSELPVRRSTSASTTRVYPSHKGKNSTWVLNPGNNQLRGHETATRIQPIHPCHAIVFGTADLSFTVTGIRCLGLTETPPIAPSKTATPGGTDPPGVFTPTVC